MAKYHLKNDGMPAVCNATVKACPRGGEEDHFDSIVEAAKASEERNKPKEVPAAVKKIPLTTRMSNAVNELPFAREVLDEFENSPEVYEEEAEAYLRAKEALDANAHLPSRELSPYRQAVRSTESVLAHNLIEGAAGVEHLPASVRERIWSKAWADGHASGYSEVYYHYTELADFASHAYGAGVEDENIRQATL